MRNYFWLAMFTLCVFSAGFLLGSQARPRTEMSQLASAQLMTHDKEVRWVGYQCGDDFGTVLTREMPSLSECHEVRRLSDTDLIDEPLG